MGVTTSSGPTSSRVIRRFPIGPSSPVRWPGATITASTDRPAALSPFGALGRGLSELQAYRAPGGAAVCWPCWGVGSNHVSYPNRYPNQARIRLYPAMFAGRMKRYLAAITCIPRISANMSDHTGSVGVRGSSPLSSTEKGQLSGAVLAHEVRRASTKCRKQPLCCDEAQSLRAEGLRTASPVADVLLDECRS